MRPKVTEMDFMYRTSIASNSVRKIRLAMFPNRIIAPRPMWQTPK